VTGRGKLTRKGMQGESYRSEGPKWFPDIPKYTEDFRKTGFWERVRCLGSEFGEWVFGLIYPLLITKLEALQDYLNDMLSKGFI
jgi:hypothetical protein